MNYLVLVNKENLIPDDFESTIELTAFTLDTEDKEVFLEKRTYEAYLLLKAALINEAGIEIGIDSAYRNVAYQRQVMDEFIEKYGEDYALKTVAIPGTSEHHTGLAIDIVPKVNGAWVIENDDMIKEVEIFKTIHEFLPKFGFIVRYPKWREEQTGYAYEPWHIRFVGDSEVAKEITCKQITLEEYVKNHRLVIE